MSSSQYFLVNQDNIKEMMEHMPEYIIKAPWYTSSSLKEKITLDHQKITSEEKQNPIPLNCKTLRYQSDAPVYKFRKGACENCGAMTHKTKDCFERPRRRGAKYSQKNFAKDEFIEEGDTNYEYKHDVWNGYQEKDEIKRFEKFNEMEKIRKKNLGLRESESENEEEKSFNNDVKKDLKEKENYDKNKEKKMEQLRQEIVDKNNKGKNLMKDDKILLNKDTDYLSRVNNKKLKYHLEKYGGEKYFFMPDSIRNSMGAMGANWLNADQEKEKIKEKKTDKKPDIDYRNIIKIEEKKVIKKKIQK